MEALCQASAKEKVRKSEADLPLGNVACRGSGPDDCRTLVLPVWLRPPHQLPAHLRVCVFRLALLPGQDLGNGLLPDRWPSNPPELCRYRANTE